MKGEKVNRRLVVIAFIVAVLLGAGGQAVALWSQSGNVTMQVTAGKTPAPTVTSCVVINGQKVNLYWEAVQGAASGYNVLVTRNGTAVPGLYRSGNTVEIQFKSNDIQMTDTWVVSVTTNYSSGWQSETLRYQFRTVPAQQGSGGDLAC